MEEVLKVPAIPQNLLIIKLPAIRLLILNYSLLINHLCNKYEYRTTNSIGGS